MEESKGQIPSAKEHGGSMNKKSLKKKMMFCDKLQRGIGRLVKVSCRVRLFSSCYRMQLEATSSIHKT
jgi:hypothetical protein